MQAIPRSGSHHQRRQSCIRDGGGRDASIGKGDFDGKFVAGEHIEAGEGVELSQRTNIPDAPFSQDDGRPFISEDIQANEVLIKRDRCCTDLVSCLGHKSRLA